MAQAGAPSPLHSNTPLPATTHPQVLAAVLAAVWVSLHVWLQMCLLHVWLLHVWLWMSGGLIGYHVLLEVHAPCLLGLCWCACDVCGACVMWVNFVHGIALCAAGVYHSLHHNDSARHHTRHPAKDTPNKTPRTRLTPHILLPCVCNRERNNATPCTNVPRTPASLANRPNTAAANLSRSSWFSLALTKALTVDSAMVEDGLEAS